MPLIPIILVLLLVVALVIATPFLLYLRYRTGTMRRRGRAWVASVNLISLGLSAALLVWVAALTTFWVPHAFSYSLAGLLAGSLLGFLGLALTRWEMTPRGLHYTPNRWLVLLVTLAVVTRLLYGLWRLWHAWRAAPSDGSWLASAGVAGSMAVGAVVVGYYLAYFAGVRWKLRAQPRTRS
ncbi:MAG: hypothetical protein QOF80_9 [Verrucomicrobiota bacterium]